MITTKKLHVFATKLGLGTDQHSLTQALQSAYCPPSHVLGWIATPEAIPEPYLSAIMNVVGDDDGEVEADANDGGTPVPVVEPVVAPQAQPEPEPEPEPVVDTPPVDETPVEEQPADEAAPADETPAGDAVNEEAPADQEGTEE